MQKTIWDKYAQVLVDYSTDVQKGDLVMIRAESFEAKDLVKAIYKRVLERGGNPIVRTALGDLGEIFLKNATDEQLDYIDPITELEYEHLNNMKKDSWSYNSRYQSLGWSESGGVKTYYVYDASVVGGEWKSVPYNKIFDSFDDFAKKHYEDEWDEDAQDYGYWKVDFDSEDYHTPNYITLKEFEDADYSDYTMMKCKISKEFYRAFISNGGVLPSVFKVEESAISDIRDAFSEAISPTVTIGWQNNDIDKEKYPIFAAIDELKEIAEKYDITNHEDVRIIFAFDN